MNQSHDGIGLLLPLLLLGVAVVSVPLARLFRLSAIIAYLVAGVVVGPFGFGLVQAPDTIIEVSELGVVLLLFLIGLELEFSRLMALRRIFRPLLPTRRQDWRRNRQENARPFHGTVPQFPAFEEYGDLTAAIKKALVYNKRSRDCSRLP